MRSFKMLLAILAAFAVYGCGGIETVSTPTAETTPAPVAAAPIVAQPPQGISAGSSVHDWWIRADGTFYVQNLSGGTTSFHACARKVYPGGEQDFSRADGGKVDGGPIPPGDIWRGQLTVTSCYMELELLESPNTCEDFKQVVGARYINVGLYCSKEPPPPVPTPTPTPVPTPSPTPRPTPTPTPKPSPSPTPTPCADNGQGCVPTPPPCPSTGAFSEQRLTSSTAGVTAYVDVSGPGSWTLSLYASSDLSEYTSNAPDYVKDLDSLTLACGASADLYVMYGWVGHPSRYWWADLKVGGVRVWKSAVIEHQ